MFHKETNSTKNQQGGGFRSRFLKAKNNLLKTKFSQEIFQRGMTVFCCVGIIVFGIALLSKADPITTSIGQDISTNNLSLSGSVTSGTWAGSSIDVAHGGTGQDWSAGAQGSFPYFSGTGALSTLTPGTAGQFLQSGGTGANPSWGNVTRSATFVIAASDSAVKSKQQADYVCDGTDDNVEIQAAIDSLPASGGSILFLEGTFVLDAPNDFYISGSKYALNVHGNNVELIGSQGTILKLKDGINVGNGAANTFVSTIIISGNNISIKNIRFNNNFANVLAYYNIAIWHGDTTLVGNYVDISYNYFENHKRWCIYGDGGTGKYWNVHHNMIVPPSTQGGIGFHNGPSYSKITDNIITNEVLQTGTGILIDSLYHVQVTGNYIGYFMSVGILGYDAVNNCIIANNIIEHGMGTSTAIQLYTKVTEGSSDNANLIQGNSFVNVPNGIVLSDSYVRNTLVANNAFTSVATPISNSGTGSIIKSNVGYLTENSGTSTITAGQTSATVTHGLATTPTRVQLTPTTNTASKSYWISAKTTTTFTITIDSTHISDITFDWRGVVGEGN